MLLVLSVTALIKVGTGHHPADVAASEPGPGCNPAACRFRRLLVGGIILMVFIYWGWDTAVVGQRGDQGQDQDPGPRGHPLHLAPAGHLRIVIFAAQSFAGIGTKGIGLANQAHAGDVLSVLGGAIFGAGRSAPSSTGCCC